MGVRSRSAVAGAQFGLAVSTAVVALSPPDIATGAMVAEIFVRGASVVFTRDGTDPTSTKGTQASVGDDIPLNSRHELDSFKVIRESADATLDVEYFTDLSG
jgi:hypothetical protein